VGKYQVIDVLAGSRLLRLGDVEEIAERLRSGGLAVLPTETGHMIAAVATSRSALLKAFAFKGRPLSNPMHVACASLDMAAKFAVLSPEARRLLGAHTPGPLTVVVPQQPVLPDDLVTLNGTVGIRVPDHPATLQVIAAVGAPLTATSLNRSGEESRPVSPESMDGFDWADDETPVVIDNEAIRYSLASTLVRVDGGTVELLREGPVSRAAVTATLGLRTG
jgi:L-threonylcarbamoyladenylate synthase